MIHVFVVLMLALAQDVPTPGSKPPTPPPKEPLKPKGTAGVFGLGTGKGSAIGKSKGASAALGLRTRQDVAGTEQGEVHAIAELAPSAPYEGPDSRPEGGAPKKAPLVYGFCAITDEWLPKSTGSYQRGELYLYRPGTKKESGTRAGKRPDEEFYHAVVEHGRIIEEAGDRRILKEFAAFGADAWGRSFDVRSFLEAMDLQVALPTDAKRVVMGILSRTVQDLVKGEKGKGDPQLKDRTRIERDDTVKGAMGRDESK